MTHLDTSFLLDLMREQTRNKPGAATAFLESQAGDELGVSVFVVCDLVTGDRKHFSAIPDLRLLTHS